MDRLAMGVMRAGIILSLVLAGAAAVERPLKRVLWLGNSLTFGGPQWEMIDALAAASPTAPRFEHVRVMMAATKMTRILASGKPQEELAKGAFDAVVIQPYGLEGDEGRAAITGFCATLPKTTRAVLYMVSMGQMESEEVADPGKRLTSYVEWFQALSAATGAWVAPARLAHAQGKRVDPVLELRTPLRSKGNVHPGEIGHYLIACVLYPLLAGECPVGNAWREVRFSEKVQPKVEPLILRLEDGEAAWLQSLAWNTLVAWQKERGIGPGFVLPPAPAGVVDTSRPEARTDAERLQRLMQRRQALIEHAITVVREGARARRRPVVFGGQRAESGPIEYLKILIADFPGSDGAAWAQRRIAELQTEQGGASGPVEDPQAERE